MDSLRSAHVEWTGSGLQFRGRGTNPDTPIIELDGDAVSGPSPMQVLLLAAATCAGIDVVLILEKMRVKINGFSIDATGERVEDPPKRFRALKLVFKLAGDGLDRAKAERAVQLSVEKYCSVIHTLAPDVQLDYEIELA